MVGNFDVLVDEARMAAGLERVPQVVVQPPERSEDNGAVEISILPPDATDGKIPNQPSSRDVRAVQVFSNALSALSRQGEELVEVIETDEEAAARFLVSPQVHAQILTVVGRS